MIGKLLHHVVPRDQVVIATKAGFGVRGGEQVVDTTEPAIGF